MIDIILDFLVDRLPNCLANRCWGLNLIYLYGMSGVKLGQVKVLDDSVCVYKFDKLSISHTTNYKSLCVHSPSFFDDLIIACEWVIKEKY